MSELRVQSSKFQNHLSIYGNCNHIYKNIGIYFLGTAKRIKLIASYPKHRDAYIQLGCISHTLRLCVINSRFTHNHNTHNSFCRSGVTHGKIMGINIMVRFVCYMHCPTFFRWRYCGICTLTYSQEIFPTPVVSTSVNNTFITGVMVECETSDPLREIYPLL